MAELKTREIRVILKEKGLERGLLDVLETQNEIIRDLQRAVREVASFLDRAMGTMAGVVTVAERMKEALESRVEDLDQNTQGLDRQ